MIVKDIRGKNRALEANIHTEILEGILKSREEHKVLTKIRRIVGQVYDLAETALAGYLAGYIASGGEQDTAAQFAEYAAVFWGGYKLGVELPLLHLARNIHKSIEDKVEKERVTAERLETMGKFNIYETEHGLDFKNHNSNYDNLVENQAQHKYWRNLETARKPVRRTVINCLYGAGAMWFASLVVDTEANIIDLVGPNPIEKGLELTHYLSGQIASLKDYGAQAVHSHVGDFDQLQMAGIGLAGGLLASAREYIKGNYQRVKAKLKR